MTDYGPFNRGVTGGYRYFYYIMTDGNVTSIIAKNAVADVQSTTTVEYTTEPNPFAQLALFTYHNELGTQDVITLECIFNKNLVKTISVDGNLQVSNAYTFNEQHLPIKIETHNTGLDGVYTRQFMYR